MSIASLLEFFRLALPAIKRHWKWVIVAVIASVMATLLWHFVSVYQSDEAQLALAADRLATVKAEAAVFKADFDSATKQLAAADTARAAADSSYHAAVAAGKHTTVYVRSTPTPGDTTFVPIAVGDLPPVQNIEAAADMDLTACGVQKDLLARQLLDMKATVAAQTAALATPPAAAPQKTRSALLGGGAGVAGAGIGMAVGGPIGLVVGGVTGVVIGLVSHD